MSPNILSHVEIHWTSCRIYKNTTANASWISHFLLKSEQVLGSTKPFFFFLWKISHRAESSSSPLKSQHCFVIKDFRKINSKHRRIIEGYFDLLPRKASLIIAVTFGKQTLWPQCVRDLEGSTVQNHEGQPFLDKVHSGIRLLFHKYWITWTAIK